ncbi:hypothetical protein G6F68_011345 [Rhizopus microsporus]|nr:hypothetical protein G6F68_011345 [Rhizopus microsporus]
MNNITSDEQQIHDDTPLTRTQVEALFRELKEQRNREREIQTNGVELPWLLAKPWRTVPQHNSKTNSEDIRKLSNGTITPTGPVSNRSTKNTSQTSKTGKWMPISSSVPFIRIQKLLASKPEQVPKYMNNFSTSKKKQCSLQQGTKKSSTTLSNKHNDSLSLALAQQSSKRMMLKTYHPKLSDYPPQCPTLGTFD